SSQKFRSLTWSWYAWYSARIVPGLRTTMDSHGWELAPDIAHRAASTIFSAVPSGGGSGRKPRHVCRARTSARNRSYASLMRTSYNTAGDADESGSPPRPGCQLCAFQFLNCRLPFRRAPRFLNAGALGSGAGAVRNLLMGLGHDTGSSPAPTRRRDGVDLHLQPRRSARRNAGRGRED